MTQLTHYNHQFSSKSFPITVVCDGVTNDNNLGSLFRICDAFGVAKLILCGTNVTIGRKMTKTSRATEKVVPYDIQSDINDVINTLKTENHCIIALEITSTSVSIHDFNLPLPLTGPISLIVGHENFGISEEVLAQCDHSVHIPMYGQNSSMNVVQATNIAIYEFTKQLV